MPWSSWSAWSFCIGGECGRTGNRSKMRKRIPYSRKFWFYSSYPHLFNVTGTLHDNDIKTLYTGIERKFGEDIQEKTEKCTIIGYRACPASLLKMLEDDPTLFLDDVGNPFLKTKTLPNSIESY